ncbi:hypothetical protein Tco_0776012 [Tanacetum coccineum]
MYKIVNTSQLSTPNSYHEIEEVSSDEDVDEWLNAEISKRMIGQDKEEEDALIDILKTVVEECKSIYKKAQIPSNRTCEIQGVSFVAEQEEGESSKTLPCKQQSKEINPGGFTLPCTISNLKIYAMADDKYGYIKNHMKTVKNKQARTREQKSEQRPEAKPGKVKPSV